MTTEGLQPRFAELGRRVAAALESPGALRLGDTCVLSTCVHTIFASRPSEVRVVARSDAGRAFYGRSLPGEVLHLDVFHAVGEADHVAMAAAARHAILKSGLPEDVASFIADMTDIQTGTGGGRLTGSLAYGSGKGPRRAHKNHVHLASLKVAREHMRVIPAVVEAVEREIVQQGLELRKVSEVVLDMSQGSPTDLSSYSSASDSFLKGEGRGQGKRVPSGETAPSASRCSGTGFGGEGAGRTDLTEPEEFANLHTVLNLLEEFETPAKLASTLRALLDGERGRDPREPGLTLQSLDQRQLEALQRTGVAAGSLVQRGLKLTSKGRTILEFITKKDREVEWLARRALARLPKPAATNAIGRPLARKGQGVGIQRAGRSPAIPRGENSQASEIAVVESVAGAFARGFPLSGLSPEDLRYYKPDKKRMPDICLVIDGSASMGGRRIRTAKYLARHLVLRTRSRTSVIVFQESVADVKMPFTRSRTRAEDCLEAVKAQGLTPMARGLMAAKELIGRSGRKAPFVFIVTDGIPTVSLWTSNPMADALRAAEELGRHRANFVCIGLEPNRQFLEQLSLKLGARCYILDELDKDKMAFVFRRSGI